MIGDTITQLQQGQPILAYAYSPHWAGAFLKLGENVVWLEVPFISLLSAIAWTGKRGC
ncbi:MAG: hypothetical protein Q6J78_01625 [Thermostichales cyanobacterium SRBZ-1_bins_19]